MFDQEWFMEQLRKMFQKQMEGASPEQKAALERTRVTIVRRSDSIELAIDSQGDADVEKIKGVLLDSMLPTLSQVVGFFGCQVEVKPQTS